MAIGHEHYDHHDQAVVATEAASVREPFGVAQAVAIALGIFFIVIGAIGLARSGLDSVTEPTVEVAGLGMTPLMAMIHLLIGVICLGGAAGRSAARGVTMFFGPLLIAAGIIALVEEIDALGWNAVNGFAYLIAGAAAIIAAMMTPAAAVESRRTIA